MTNLNELIIECIEKKPGNKEFALFFNLDGEPVWEAMLGNELPIPLAESRGEFLGTGASPEESVKNLKSNLLSSTLNEDYDWLLALPRTPWLEDFAEGREYNIWGDKSKLYSDLLAFIHSKGKGE
ncbi:hypothetical protein M8009_17445 [Halomonas sp. ATCH28]|uniref:DUF2750 domain-containing protein n=1 Tax=Halomonas gemina TaxID=2945105 RepID=A0ABT0T571_9GAMM|nr:hypothetical protein [Halomonas gemina]MCL7942071.1 hypothetical protein [Halomonas gemina]